MKASSKFLLLLLQLSLALAKEPKEVQYDVGDEIRLLMPNAKWTESQCLWNSEFTYSFSFGDDDLDEKKKDQNVEGRYYRHYGSEDECGIWISKAVDKDDHVWKGTANLGENDQEEYEFNVVIRAAPKEISMESDDLDADHQLHIELDEEDEERKTIECIVKGGRPRPKVYWSMDGFSLDTSNVTDEYDEGKHELVSTFKGFLARPAMDGKKLRCSATHPKLTNRLEEEITLDIDGYPDPTELSLSYSDSSLTLGSRNSLIVRIFSKPAPQFVSWQSLPGLDDDHFVVFKHSDFDEDQIDEETRNDDNDDDEKDDDKKGLRANEEKAVEGRDSSEIEETEAVEDGRYKGSIEIVSDDEREFVITLELDSLEERDLERTFELLVINEFGRTVYDLRFEEEEQGGLPWWAVVLIVLGIVVVLGGAALAAGFFFYMKKKERSSALPPASNSRMATYTNRLDEPEPMATIKEVHERSPDDHMREEQL